MKRDNKKALSDWESTNLYRLSIKKSKEFIIRLIENLPDDSIMSFEGNIKIIKIPAEFISNNHSSKMPPPVPKLNNHIFSLSKHSKHLLINDFIHRIGIRTNVIHISVEYKDKLIFNSNDNMNDESVFISCGKYFSTMFLNQLKTESIIRKFEKVKIQ